MAEKLDNGTFKVSIESLHTTRVKEINYEGEEVYQDKPSLSQRLSEMARRVNFSDEYTGDEESTDKSSAHKWPWEFTHSKLKQALTEVSVLSDVLRIVHNHRQYITLDPVVSTATPHPLTYQYNIKKKALSVAASIIRKGAEPLVKVSMHSEREFHRALAELRKTWRLRRTSSGVAGDLSYHSGGSSYAHLVPFELRKGSEGSGEILTVIVPQELRGRSEVVVFLSDRPVREVDSVEPLLHSAMVEQRRSLAQLPPWEQKMKAAQNVLFNQEVFAQLAREAYDKRVDLQSEVFSNRINIPLSLNCWLSVLLVREYEEDKDKQKTKTSQDLPKPNWLLSVALKQLLREHHRHTVAVQPPQPSNATLGESPEMRAAGSSALSFNAIKQLEYDTTLYDKLIKMARHLYNEKKLVKWLNSFCESCRDPLVSITWIPHLSLTSTLAIVTLRSSTGDGTVLPRYTIEITLSVDEVTIQSVDGDPSLLPVDEDRLINKLKQQIVGYRTNLASQCAKDRKWHVLHQSTLPLPSIPAFKLGGIKEQGCILTIESPCGMRRIDLVIEYDRIRASSQQDRYNSRDNKDQLTLNSSDINHEFSFTNGSNTMILGANHGHSFIKQLSAILDQQTLR